MYAKFLLNETKFDDKPELKSDNLTRVYSARAQDCPEEMERI